MRWPFRRSTADSTTTTTAPPAAAAAAGFDAPAPSGSRPTSALAPPPLPPRGDWARIEPLHVSAAAAPPLTFHGDTFGRNVAGGRPLHAVRHRHPAASAPAGVLLNIAEFEAVFPTPTIPDVHELGELPDVVHRTAAAAPEATNRPEPLLWSDVDVTFRSPDPVHTEPVTTISWTAEDGFIDPPPSQPSNMRLVGQRGSYDEAVSADAETDAYSANADDADEHSVATIRYVPAIGRREERSTPPADVVSAVGDATGVNVGDTSIITSREVDERAADLGAIAFTESDDVHVASGVGTIDSPATKAIVAHELTHVAQQRKLGGDVPPEDSDEGRALEAEARRVQRSFDAGDVVTPTFLRRSEDRPISATPAGVQRLAAGADPYAWQDRPEPPEPTFDADHDGEQPEDYDADHDARSDADHDDGEASDNPVVRQNAWAQRFETEHSRQLQQIRDQRYTEMQYERRTEMRVDRLPTVAHEQLRRDLDAELPYEFGPPDGTEPYPALPDSSTRSPRSATGIRSTGRAPRSGRPQRTLAQRAASATKKRRQREEEDEAAHTLENLRHAVQSMPTSTEAERHASSEMAENMLDWADALGAREDANKNERQRMERALREDSLTTKRGAAFTSGAGPNDLVRLTYDERDAIREVVDALVPRQGSDDPDYLGDDNYGSMAVLSGDYGPIDAVEEGAEPADRATSPARTGTPPQPASPAPEINPSIARPPANAAARPDAPTTDTANGAAVAGNVQPVAPDAEANGAAESAEPGAADQVATVDEDGGDPTDAFGAAVADISELDLETLSRRLYGRLRRDLRRELLIDRERAGSLADVC